MATPADPAKVNRPVQTALGPGVAWPIELHFMSVGIKRAAADATGDIEFDILSNLDGKGFDPMTDLTGGQEYAVICIGAQDTATIGAPASIGINQPRVFDPFNGYAGLAQYARVMFSNGAAVIGQRAAGVLARVVDATPNGWELLVPLPSVINPRKLTVHWEKVGAGLNVIAHLMIFGKRNPFVG